MGDAYTMVGASAQSYQVPIIGTDMHQEQMIHQVADSLEYLKKVTDDVFNRITKRVSDNRAELAKVDARVEVAKAKLDRIRGSRKATTVFSSSKFPVTVSNDGGSDYHTLFTKEKSLQAPKRPSRRLQHKPEIAEPDAVRGKLKFYNVQVKRDEVRRDNKGEGLGRLPANIDSVSSLLLFNTGENPYKKYVTLDPLGVVTKTRSGPEEELRGPDDAPSTILHGDALERGPKETYFYTPGMGEVPEISVPDFLPDLLGVADDLSYGAEMGPSIAPSMLGKDMPDLPDIITDAPDLPTIPGPAEPIPGAIDTPGPPPPPPPAPPAAAAPPPPPPPPTETPASQAPEVWAPPPPEVPAEVSASDGGRGSLMDAIRNAGGAGKAKLKKAKERKLKKKEAVAPAASSGGGGDLMSDLAAELAMRRKGISSGSKSSSKPTPAEADEDVPKPPGGGGTTMDKISAMISYNPPTDNACTDDDWND